MVIFHNTEVGLEEGVLSGDSGEEGEVTDKGEVHHSMLLPQGLMLLPQDLVLLPQGLVPLPQDPVLLPQGLVPLPQDMVLLPQDTVLLPQELVLLSQDLVGPSLPHHHSILV
jgi:hypothetical protein